MWHYFKGRDGIFMRVETLGELEKIKKDILRASELQGIVDELTKKILEPIETKIKENEKQIKLKNDAIIKNEKSLAEQTELLNSLRRGELNSNLSSNFGCIGIFLGGIIGTSIFPIIGTIVGGIIGSLVFKIIAKIISWILRLITPKKIKARKKEEKIKKKKVSTHRIIKQLYEQGEKYNSEKIELTKKNAELYKEKNSAISKIAPFNDELLAIKPPQSLGIDYCELYIINDLIDLVKSGRADTIKEALNLYEDELHREIMLKLQEEQLRVGKQLTEQQAQLLKQQIKQSKQLRYSNTLNTVNTVRHWSKTKKVHVKFK